PSSPAATPTNSASLPRPSVGTLSTPTTGTSGNGETPRPQGVPPPRGGRPRVVPRSPPAAGSHEPPAQWPGDYGSGGDCSGPQDVPPMRRDHWFSAMCCHGRV